MTVAVQRLRLLNDQGCSMTMAAFGCPMTCYSFSSSVVSFLYSPCPTLPHQHLASPAFSYLHGNTSVELHFYTASEKKLLLEIRLSEIKLLKKHTITLIHLLRLKIIKSTKTLWIYSSKLF
jgi:hypothetical protein